MDDVLHELVDYQVACAYWAGYEQALRDVAERSDALDRSWQPAARRDPEQVVAERVAAMQALARTNFGGRPA